MDLKSYSRWYDYSRARDAMFLPRTRPGRRGTSPVPTTRNTRASISSGTSSRTSPMRTLSCKKVKLPDRQKPGGYVEPNYPFKFVPELEWREN